MSILTSDWTPQSLRRQQDSQDMNRTFKVVLLEFMQLNKFEDGDFPCHNGFKLPLKKLKCESRKRSES